MRRALFVAAVAALVACGGSVARIGDGGADAGGGADTAAPPQQCLKTKDCGAGAYCVFGGTCGKDGALGSCKPLPHGCADILQPACGCDGETYGNACAANTVGVDTSGDTRSCPLGPASFACGNIFCDARTTYCLRSLSDVGGQPETDTCPMLPASCVATTSCKCFPASTPCVSACTQVPTAGGPSYGLQLTCPGG